jgi:hypothetical protein
MNLNRKIPPRMSPPGTSTTAPFPPFMLSVQVARAHFSLNLTPKTQLTPAPPAPTQ